MAYTTPLHHDDPDRVGPFTLLGRLGGGGMGTVFLARSAGGRIVALKTVHEHLAQEPEFRIRFRLEAEAARTIGGLHGAAVVDADTQGALPWLATDYVLGPALSDAVTEYGPLPEATVRAVGAALARALVDIHRAGIVHRDLKPSNVLVTATGPRVIDFGIARALGARRLTSTGQVVGTPAHMSPEQASGREHGPQGDVFALAGVLVFAATGHGPFPGEQAADVLYRVRYGEADLAGLPEGLRPTLERCLAKEPDERPEAEELADRLGTGRGAFADVLPGPVLGDISRRTAAVWQVTPTRLPAPAAASGTGMAAVPRALSRRRLLTGGGALVALGVGGAAWAAYGDGAGKSGDGGTVAPKPSRAPGLGPEPDWTFRADEEVSPLGLADGVLVLGGDEAVYGVDVRTGKRLWQRGPLLVTDVTDEGLLLTLPVSDGGRDTSLEHGIMLLDPKTGKTTPPPGDLRRPLHVVESIDRTGQPGVVHVWGSTDIYPVVAAYDVRAGRLKWSNRLTGENRPNPRPGAVTGGVLLCNSESGEIIGLDAADGVLRWRRTVTPPDDKALISRIRPASVADGRLYLGGTEITALEAATGKVLWRWGADRKVDPQPDGQYYGPPRVTGGMLYCTALDGPRPDSDGGFMHSLIALEAASGKPLWSYQHALNGDFDTAPEVHGSTVFLGTHDARQPLLAVDTRTRRPPWSFRPHKPDGSAIGGLLLREGTLYVAHGASVTALPMGPGA